MPESLRTDHNEPPPKPAAAVAVSDAPAILMLQSLEATAMAWLQARHHVAVRPGLAHDDVALLAALESVQALVLPPGVKVDRALLAAAPRLRVVARLGGGTESTDYEACNRRRVRVVNAAGAVARSQAEYFLTGLLLLLRDGMGVRSLQAGALAVGGGRGRELDGAAVGLLGITASIHLLAPLLDRLGVQLLGYDPTLHATSELWARLGVRRLPLADMLASADAVICSIPYASRYRGLLSERRLSGCKSGQVWVATTASAVFEALALADALRARQIGAAMLDHCDPELLAPGAALDGLPNLIVTGGAAPDSREAFLRESWFLLDRIHEALQLPALLFEPLSPRKSRPMIL